MRSSCVSCLRQTWSSAENLPPNAVKDLSTSFARHLDFTFVRRWILRCGDETGVQRRIRLDRQLLVGLLFEFDRRTGHPIVNYLKRVRDENKAFFFLPISE